MYMNMLFCAVAVIFAFMGMLIRIGKADGIMGGFVKNFKKKRETYDLTWLRAFVSKVLYFCAVCFAIMAAGEMVQIKMITWAGIILFVVAVFYSARYTEIEDNFKKEL